MVTVFYSDKKVPMVTVLQKGGLKGSMVTVLEEKRKETRRRREAERKGVVAPCQLVAAPCPPVAAVPWSPPWSRLNRDEGEASRERRDGGQKEELPSLPSRPWSRLRVAVVLRGHRSVSLREARDGDEGDASQGLRRGGKAAVTFTGAAIAVTVLPFPEPLIPPYSSNSIPVP
ncbi:uncharacterized protein DS421_10g306820 [Arachis hypogaea]|nr:uncharacterized protein DS421_10g306820 [Arachis hypogaea]